MGPQAQEAQLGRVLLRLQVLTDDPGEANMFFINALAYYYSSNIGDPSLHMQDVIRWVRGVSSDSGPASAVARPRRPTPPPLLPSYNRPGPPAAPASGVGCVKESDQALAHPAWV
jgi:hypothetical protein